MENLNASFHVRQHRGPEDISFSLKLIDYFQLLHITLRSAFNFCCFFFFFFCFFDILNTIVLL